MKPNKRLQKFVNWAYKQPIDEAVEVQNWYCVRTGRGCFLGEFIINNPKLGLKLIQSEVVHNYNIVKYGQYRNKAAVREYFNIPYKIANNIFFYTESGEKTYEELRERIRACEIDGIEIPTT